MPEIKGVKYVFNDNKNFFLLKVAKLTIFKSLKIKLLNICNKLNNSRLVMRLKRLISIYSQKHIIQHVFLFAESNK